MRFAWLARLVGRAMASYLRLVARTSVIRGPVTREQVILAFWHEYNLAVFAVAVARRRDLPHASFSTTGFRGIMVSAMLAHSGAPVRIVPLPPSDDRGAAARLARRLGRLAREGDSLIVTPDGPFGPYHVAKPGAIILARQSGLPIQPWTLHVRPQLRLTGRWDRHVVPLPFSRIRVAAGKPLLVGRRDAVPPAVEELARRLAAGEA